MKNFKIKVLSIFLILTLVFSCLFGISINALASDVLFKDEFNSGMSGAWSDIGFSSVEDGKMVLSKDNFIYVNDNFKKQDYIVSADVSVNTGDKSGFVSIVAMTNGSRTSGYEYGLGLSNNNSVYLRLYRRGKSTSEILYQSSNIEGIGMLSKKKTYSLKLAVTNGKVYCMINGVVFTKFDDLVYSSGFAGVSTTGMSGIYDNFTIEKLPPKKIETIIIDSHSSEIALTEKINFNATVKYNSIYGSETINQDTKGVTLSGYDGNAGEKSINVLYKGCQATFNIKINGTYKSKVLFEDNFSLFNQDNYTGGKSSYFDDAIIYRFINQNGKEVVEYPNLGSSNIPIKTTLLLKDSLSNEWETYSVSSDLIINKDATTSTERLANGAIVFAKSQMSEQYNFRVSSNGALSIYCGSVLLASTTADKNNITISKGNRIQVKVDVYESYAKFYCNNKCVATYYFSDNIQPCCGLMAINGGMSFDNFKVSSLLNHGSYAAKSMSVIFSDGSKATEVFSKSIEDAKLFLKITYTDGAVDYKRVTDNMLENYDADATVKQKIIVKYGELTETFNYTCKPYLYYDTFSGNSISNMWSYGDNDNMSIGVSDGKLNFLYNPKGAGSSTSINAYIPSGTMWNNYSVSADVFMDPGKSSLGRTRMSSLLARRNGRNWYEFRVNYNADGYLIGYLYRFDNGTANLLYNFTSGMLSDCLPEGKTLGTGETYNMKITVFNNIIECYFENKLLVYYVDDSDNVLLSGTAGIRNINNTAYYDNFIVEEKNNLKISKLLLSGVKDNTIELYRGHDIETWKYNLQLVYSDGTYDEIPLTNDMISDFDNTALGKQKVKLKYKDYSYDAYVFISERKDFISDFSKSLKSFSKKITDNNISDFLNIKDSFDSLSDYEREQVDKSLIDKYKNLFSEYEKHYYKEAKSQDLLYAGFTDKKDFDTWTTSIEGGMGKWFLSNQMMYEAQRTYGMNGTAWHSPDVYGDIRMISADMNMVGIKMYAGMALNVGESGYYYVRISSKTVDADGEVTYTLQLMKRTLSGGHKVLASTEPMNYDVDISAGKWFRMTLTNNSGKLKIFINDKLMIDYDDSDSTEKSTFGECGLRIAEGDCLCRNVRVYGKSMQRPEQDSDENIKPTKYNDNFDDEKVGTSPSHWQENSTAIDNIDNWKVYEKNGSNVYGTKNTSGKTATWLHVFDKNPEISTKFMVESKTSSSKIGFITRMSPETAFVNIGYDFSTSKWFVLSQKSDSDGLKQFYADDKSELSLNKWHTIKIVESKSSIKVEVDNKEVLTSDQINRVSYGRIGMYTENASMYVDDFKSVFNSGDIPQDGVISYSINPDVYSGYLEIESLDGKTLIGANDNYKVLSDDSGLTWKNITDDEDWEGLFYDGMYTSMLKLKSNNQYLQVLTKDEIKVQASSDLKNWKDIGQIVPKGEELDENGNKVAIIHANSLTQVKLSDNKYRIFCPVGFRKYKGAQNKGHYTKIYYSDDNGVTWNCAENDTRDVLPGYYDDDSTSWAESKVIRCSDGTLRMYYSRNGYGCMQYTVSKDNGVTWSGLYQIPEMQCSKTSFAVYEDPNNEGIYYMLWVNGTPTYQGSMFPRSRICLAKSTDGKNWKFVMNCERMEHFYSPQNGQAIFQVLDPSLCITDDYVYITFGRSSKEHSEISAGTHQAQRVYYIRAEKDKLKTRDWDASTVSSMNFPKSVKIKTYPQTKFGLGDLFNSHNATVELTALNGKVTTEKFELNCKVNTEPNMFKLGKQKISATYSTGYNLDYDIEIVPNYNIKWNISDGGKVEPKSTRIMQGAKQKFTLVPDAGNKVAFVKSNGNKIRILNNSFVIKNVKENLEIEVVFKEKTILDYWWIGLILIILGFVTYLCIFKKNWLLIIKDKVFKKEKVSEKL